MDECRDYLCRSMVECYVSKCSTPESNGTQGEEIVRGDLIIFYMVIKFDGDQVSVKACWTKEANEDAERYINSNAYVINIQGKNMRELTKDFILTQYMLTNPTDAKITADCNVSKPKYAL